MGTPENGNFGTESEGQTLYKIAFAVILMPPPGLSVLDLFSFHSSINHLALCPSPNSPKRI